MCRCLVAVACVSLAFGPGARSKGRVLSNDELFALWRAAGRMPYPVGPAYRLLCLTALRLNEVVARVHHARGCLDNPGRANEGQGQWQEAGEAARGPAHTGHPHPFARIAKIQSWEISILDQLGPEFGMDRNEDKKTP